MRIFYNLLLNALVVAIKNNFVWFALVYWIYLSTHSVISTSLVGGIYLVAASLSGFWFGSLVDKHKKKHVMLGSGLATLILFSLGLVFYLLAPESAFTTVNSPTLWVLVFILLGGSIAGNLFNIAVPTLITALVPEEDRDRANGMFGMVMGVAFSITSFASGIVLGFGGMPWVLGISIVGSILVLIHLASLNIPEPKRESDEEPETQTTHIDIRGTIKIISSVPGLFALIFFTTFNNFLGGVFMALMDAYGLSLVSVQVWGVLWGFLSFSFILSGMYISKKGLGKNLLKNLFRINIIIWTASIFFTIQPSIILLSAGAIVWMFFIPFIEATEHTIIQKVVPPTKQGRVFGFAQSVEQAASPLTAFLIGPIAQYVFIPFMTTGKGVELIGSWYGVGEGRGMALVFSLAGLIGLCATLIAMRSNSYKLLAEKYREK